MKNFLKNLLHSTGLVILIVAVPYLFQDKQFVASEVFTLEHIASWLLIIFVVALLFTSFDWIWKKMTKRKD